MRKPFFDYKELDAPNRPKDVFQLVRELLRAAGDYTVLSRHFSRVRVVIIQFAFIESIRTFTFRHTLA